VTGSRSGRAGNVRTVAILVGVSIAYYAVGRLRTVGADDRTGVGPPADTHAHTPSRVTGGQAPALSAWRRGGPTWWVVPPLVLALLGGWLVARRHGFWFDELYTAEVAPLALRDIVGAAVRGEGTIPYLRDAPPSYSTTYYAVAHVWLTLTGLAAEESGLRFLSLLSSVGALGAFTLAVGRLAGHRVGLVAGLVAATNPFVVQYSVEARGYGLALLATAVAALGLTRWLDDRPRSLLLYGGAGAAAGLAHWFTLLVLGSFALAALALRGRRARPVVVVTTAAAVPALGMIALAVGNGVGSSGAEWISGVGGAVPRLLIETWAGHRLPLLVATLATATAGLVLESKDDGREPRIVAAIWFGLPLAAVTALEFMRPVFVARYLLPATLGLAVLMALGITRLPRVASVVSLVVVLAASVWASAAVVRRGPREDVRGAVAAVAGGHTPGQPVVAAARWDALGVDHYARRDHAGLVRDLVLPPAGVPPSSAVWVVGRAGEGVKGDAAKRTALDTDLRARGMHVTLERRFEGRSADVVIQRWDLAAPGR